MKSSTFVGDFDVCAKMPGAAMPTSGNAAPALSNARRVNFPIFECAMISLPLRGCWVRSFAAAAEWRKVRTSAGQVEAPNRALGGAWQDRYQTVRFSEAGADGESE